MQDWFGINLEHAVSTIVQIQGAVRSLPGAETVRWQPQAQAVCFDSAQELQVAAGRKAKSHDREAHSRARKCWTLL